MTGRHHGVAVMELRWISAQRRSADGSAGRARTRDACSRRSRNVMRGRGRPSASRCSKSGRMRLSGEGSCSVIVANPSSRERAVGERPIERGSSQPLLQQFANGVLRCAHGPRPAAVVELNPERGVLCPPGARARRLDARRRERSAIRPQRLACESPTELRRMIHQVAPHLIAGIRDATRTRIAPRLQQQLRRFDSVGGDDEHLADGALLAAVRTLEPDRGDATVGADSRRRRRPPDRGARRRRARPARRAPSRRTSPARDRSECNCCCRSTRAGCRARANSAPVASAARVKPDPLSAAATRRSR